MAIDALTTAPIALFTYNRPWHTQQTVKALLKNAQAKGSDLFVFSDGPKNKATKEKVDEVRQYLRTIEGFKSVRIVERKENSGLAQSIISGVTEVVNEHGKVIVLEDDLVTSPYFLKFMNEGLNCYAQDNRVISIHGYCYPVEGLPETFFLKGTDCWGWATWKRGWNLFEADGRKLLAALIEKNLLERFDFFGAYDYSGMLRGQIAGKNQSWAVRWYASALLRDRLTLYPRETLVQNIGLDGSGVHCANDHHEGPFNESVSMTSVDFSVIPVKESQEALKAFSCFLRQASPGLAKRVMYKLGRLVR